MAPGQVDELQQTPAAAAAGVHGGSVGVDGAVTPAATSTPNGHGLDWSPINFRALADELQDSTNKKHLVQLLAGEADGEATCPNCMLACCSGRVS